MVIPHTEIPISSIRPNDILLLLTLGAVMEFLCRITLSNAKLPSTAERSLKNRLHKLRIETNKARSKGPSAFVETSKLERKVLALEKELAELSEKRKGHESVTQGRVKRMQQVMNLALFLIYYGIPVMVLDGLALSLNHPALVPSRGDEDGMESQCASAFYRAMLFPISYIGIGMRIAKMGCAGGSIGALIVYWSAQVTVGKVYDGCELLYLR